MELIVKKVLVITRLLQEEPTQTRRQITKRLLVLITINVLVVPVFQSDVQEEKSALQALKEVLFAQLEGMSKIIMH